MSVMKLSRCARDILQRPAGARHEFERIDEPERETLGTGPGDHRAIVGAKLRRWNDEHRAAFKRKAMQDLSLIHI